MSHGSAPTCTRAPSATRGSVVVAPANSNRICSGCALAEPAVHGGERAQRVGTRPPERRLPELLRERALGREQHPGVEVVDRVDVGVERGDVAAEPAGDARERDRAEALPVGEVEGGGHDDIGGQGLRGRPGRHAPSLPARPSTRRKYPYTVGIMSDDLPTSPQPVGRLISADSHVQIPVTVVRERVPAALRDAFDDAIAESAAEDRANKGGREFDLSKWDLEATKDPGYRDPHARLAAMDRDGVAAEVLYSEVSAFRHFGRDQGRLEADQPRVHRLPGRLRVGRSRPARVSRTRYR